ncbi:glutathione S-transferase N-terminal domain-containing protein [Candidatus Babeliales bacterium]|nr:glutathione S-transferase N-terminal domain-containing protein [Candidatus Babeliales bacterium]MBP9843570.1 glutathione S-transferase N-terminal domain-containing protein [Candidatus Babeliales bacterium]
MKKRNVIGLLFVVGIVCFLSAHDASQQVSENEIMQKVDESHQAEIVEKAKVQLFMYQGCSYCVHVYSFLQSKNLLDQVEIIYLDSSEKIHLLKSISGRTQAPYIVDAAAGVSMAESLDIIEYFKKKYVVESDLSTQAMLQVETPATDHLKIADENCKAKSNQYPKSYNPKTFISEMQAFKKPVIILISTTWCPPCKVFKPIFLQVAQEFADQCEFICLDGDLNGSIVETLGVQCYPTVVCFKNGQQINPKNYRTKSGLFDLVSILLKK